MTFLHVVELPRGVIVDEGENLLDIELDLVYFFDRSLIFNDVLLVFTLRLLNFLLELFLEFLALVVFAEPLVSILFNLVFDFGDLVIKCFIFPSKLVDVFG